MRILMLPKCTSSHASREVRTLISHTDKKYTVSFFSRKLCGAQGHSSPQMLLQRESSPINCVLHRDTTFSPAEIVWRTGTQTPPDNAKTASRRLFGCRDAAGIVWCTGTVTPPTSSPRTGARLPAPVRYRHLTR